MNNTIKISSIIGNALRSRVEANIIYNSAKDLNSRDIILDFKNVQTVSRSFTDELCEMIDLMKKNNINVNIENANKTVNMFMKIVSEGREKQRMINIETKRYDFNCLSGLTDFLSTI